MSIFVSGLFCVTMGVKTLQPAHDRLKTNAKMLRNVSYAQAFLLAHL